MTQELKAKLEAIKAECRRAVALAEKATLGPWLACGPWLKGEDRMIAYLNSREVGEDSTEAEKAGNNAHIAHSRQFAPAAAKALLTTIEALQGMSWPFRETQCDLCDNDGMTCQACENALAALEQIAREWEAKQ